MQDHKKCVRAWCPSNRQTGSSKIITDERRKAWWQREAVAGVSVRPLPVLFPEPKTCQ